MLTFDSNALVLVDFTARIKDTDEVFETTFEDIAKKHFLTGHPNQYQPRLISINNHSYPVIQGLNEALVDTSVGDKLTVVVTPDKAFGERNTRNIQMVPIRKLGDDADKASVGDTIDIDKRSGIIRFIGSGRVQIDFNHKYAGKTIIYDVNVRKSLDTDREKIQAILKRHFIVPDDKISFDLTDTEARISIPLSDIPPERLSSIKHFIQTNIFKFVPTLAVINFVETYRNNQVHLQRPAAPPATDTIDTAGSDTPSDADTTDTIDTAGSDTPSDADTPDTIASQQPDSDPADSDMPAETGTAGSDTPSDADTTDTIASQQPDSDPADTDTAGSDTTATDTASKQPDNNQDRFV